MLYNKTMTQSPKYSLDNFDLQSAFRHALTGAVAGLVLVLPGALQNLASGEITTSALQVFLSSIITGSISGIARAIERYFAGEINGEKGDTSGLEK
jgi:hypothetical protein